MAKKNNPYYQVGFGKPPRHTQFKPGQSGNAKGRPKKASTFADDIEKELNGTVVVMDNGRQRRITIRQAIVKQHLSKAARGDVKSTALVFVMNKRPHSDPEDNLSSLLEEFREKNARHDLIEEPKAEGEGPDSPNE